MARPSNRASKRIPDNVIERLPKYLRALIRMEEASKESVSSKSLGDALNYSPAQIRKDLSYFGRFGKRGRGYEVKKLKERLKSILGLGDRQWNMALVGVGKLGRAILGYGRFATQGFRIVAAFDRDPTLVSKKVGSLTIQDMGELAETIRNREIQIGIVAVPASQAQEVIAQLENAGIKAILNYAPITLAPQRPEEVKIQDVDPILQLQMMTFFMKNQGEPKK